MVNCGCQFFEGLHLFEGLPLLFLPNFPESKLIQESTLIRKSRVSVIKRQNSSKITSNYESTYIRNEAFCPKKSKEFYLTECNLSI